MLQHIENFERKIKMELPYLEKAVKSLETIQEDDTHKYYMLTAMFGVKAYQAFLDWCHDSKQLLNK